MDGVEIVADKVKLTRNGELLTGGGHFPRLAQRDARARLGELKKLLLALCRVALHQPWQRRA